MNRTLVVFASILALSGGAVAITSCQRQQSKETTSEKKGRSAQRPQGVASGRALSLRVLQKTLQDCAPRSACPEEVLQMVGIKKILGYVIDSSNEDIIVFGSLDAALPPLHLEDFIIALRNTWMKYAERRGNTLYYSNPGCSIDPDPSVLRLLEEAAEQILKERSPERIQRHLTRWHTVCRQPQQVRVLGIPFNTRFAGVMVEADYYMKRLVDGSVTLDIPGFVSLTDITLAIAREGIEKGENLSIPTSTLDRFWFYPGENAFLEDTDVIYIQKSEVVLLTEQEFLSAREQVVGTGKANPLAKRFADGFTARYAAIAKAKPVYAELEALFRFVAIARIMKHRSALSESRINLDYLLDHFPLNQTPVSGMLPGISSVKEFTHRTEMPGGYSMLYLWLPSCGGVGIDIKINQNDMLRDKTGKLLQIRASVLKTRPGADALYWNVSA